VLEEPHQDLARAAEFEELLEDLMNCLLDPLIWVGLQPLIPGLDVPDRCRDDELSPLCLRVSCLERTLAEKVELVLAEAALQTQQEAVIRQPRVVNGLMVDEEGIDKAAHLDELVPVPVVAGEARYLARSDCPDLAHADGGDHLLKTCTSCRRCRREAEVIVNDLDVAPTKDI